MTAKIIDQNTIVRLEDKVWDFDEDERRLLFTPCKTKEDLHSWICYFLDLDLPDSIVDPDSNCTPLEMVWYCYNHIVHAPENDDVSRVLFFAGRFGGKTLAEACIETLLLVHSWGDLTHLASIERQSRDCVTYVGRFFSLPLMRGIISASTKTEKAATRYVPLDPKFPILLPKEWKELSQEDQLQYQEVTNKLEVLVASIQSVNGKHTALLCLDEIEIIPSIEAYKEAKLIPVPTRRPDGSEISNLTVLTSTRKYSFGIMAKEIEGAQESGLVVKHWNTLEVTERCPASRHLPDEPKVPMWICDDTLSAIPQDQYDALSGPEQKKYYSHLAYSGCTTKCRMLAVCRGFLATNQTSTSKFLKPIKYIQNQIRSNSLEKVQSQLLCRKPSSQGLIYPAFSKGRHQIPPAVAYEKITGSPCPNQEMSREEFLTWALESKIGEWFGGTDWGTTHVTAHIMGLKFGNMMFVCKVFAAPDLDPSEKIDALDPFIKYGAVWFPDVEDPAMVKQMKKKVIVRKWNKGAGSVDSGITIVKMKLNPVLAAAPDLFFVRDPKEDPLMDMLITHMSEHHYKLDMAGQPTKNVSDEDKDLPDALRYMVMNVFNLAGKVCISKDVEIVKVPRNSDGSMVLTGKNWQSATIARLTGDPDYKSSKVPRKMTVETLDGYDWYASMNKDKGKEKKDRRGKGRTIAFDFE